MTKRGADQVVPAKTSRRSFLLGLSISTLLPSTIGCLADDGTGSSASAVTTEELERFIALSALLTGSTKLDRRHGTLYVESLIADAGRARMLQQLLERAGFHSEDPPKTTAQLESTGIFEDASLRELADTITLQWYTGVYDAGGTQKVATYRESLAWQAVSYASPPTRCGGGMGFWANPPRDSRT